MSKHTIFLFIIAAQYVRRLGRIRLQKGVWWLIIVFLASHFIGLVPLSSCANHSGTWWKWLTKWREECKSASPNMEIVWFSVGCSKTQICSITNMLPKADDVPFISWIYICGDLKSGKLVFHCDAWFYFETQWSVQYSVQGLLKSWITPLRYNQSNHTVVITV